MPLPDLDDIFEEPVESNKPEFIEKNDLPELPDF
jgi:hypothetical protein